MDVQKIVNILFDEVAHILVDTLASGIHRQRAQFYLRLALEHWFFHVDGYSRNNTVSDVTIFNVLAGKFLNSLCYMLLESALMSTSLRGVLTIDKRMILLSILIGMSERYLYILALNMDDGI